MIWHPKRMNVKASVVQRSTNCIVVYSTSKYR